MIALGAFLYALVFLRVLRGDILFLTLPSIPLIPQRLCVPLR